MANLKVLLLTIFFIASIMISSISTEEAAAAAATEAPAATDAAAHDHKEGEDHDHDHEGHDHDHDHGDEDGSDGYDDDHPEREGMDGEEGEAQGNIFDESGAAEMKELGFDTKETLTREEMKVLYEKIFLKKEVNDPQEIEFYHKLIEKTLTDIPESVKIADVRQYFEVSFLMKHIDKEEEPAEGEKPAGEATTPEGAKEDM